MKKPFYSKRRLKKMGVCIEVKNNELEINILSISCSIRQSQNILKMIKASEKPINVNMDGMVAFVSSFIHQDMERLRNKIFDYKYYPEQMFTAIPNKMFFP